LAHASCSIEGVEESAEVILPRKTVLELQRLLDDVEDPVTVDVSAGQIRFRFGTVELISKLVEGKFPDYKRVIPTNYVNYFDVSREALLASLQRAAILSTDKLRSVRFQMADNVLTASSSNAEQEEALEEIEIEYGFDPLDVGFNVSYLLDFLSSIKSETVRWYVMSDANASALLTLPDDDSFQYVVMPMRI
jgi:DNA polymerase-3 subunit beta